MIGLGYWGVERGRGGLERGLGVALVVVIAEERCYCRFERGAMSCERIEHGLI